MSIKLDKYTPLMMYLSPASIPQIVAHIQDYLVKHPILSVETIAEIIVQSLQEHPELINGEAIPISPDSEQSIKAYIDSLPSIDTYTKAEINMLLTGKQDTLTFDQAPTPGSSNPVTSSGIIAAMSALQSALETQISNKADRASTYTKTQVDTLLEDKADADDVYSKNTMDAKLLEINTNISGKVPTSRKINNKALSADITLTGEDIPVSSSNASSLSQQIGNVALPTTAQTLTGAIAENHNQIGTLQNANYYKALYEGLQRAGTGTITLPSLNPDKVYPVFIANEQKYFVGMLHDNSGWKLYGAKTFTDSEVSCTSIDTYSCTITIPSYTRYLIMEH